MKQKKDIEKDIEQVKESDCKHEEQVTEKLDKVTGGAIPPMGAYCPRCNWLFAKEDFANGCCPNCKLKFKLRFPIV